MRVAWLGCAASIVSCFVLSQASAQYHSDDEPISGELKGRMRFQVEVPVFAYQSLMASSDSSEGDFSINTVAIGPLAVDQIAPRAGVGLGYALSDAIVIGGGLGFGYTNATNSEVDDAHLSRTVLSVSPYFQYMGGDSATKPFLGAQLQLMHMASGETDADGDERDSSMTFGGIGLQGGAVFFLSSGCSIDLTGKLGYSVLLSADPALDDGESLALLDFVVTLGVSAWVL